MENREAQHDWVDNERIRVIPRSRRRGIRGGVPGLVYSPWSIRNATRSAVRQL